MRRGPLGAALIALVTTTAAAPAAGPQPWTPAGKWNVEYADQKCLASRSFSSGERSLTIAIAPPPASKRARLWVLQPANQPRLDDAQIITGGVPLPERGMWLRGVSANGQRVFEAGLAQPDYARLLSTGSLQIRASKIAAEITLSKLAEVQRLLDDCNASLLKDWGFPADLQQNIRELEDTKTGGFIRASDYPADARDRDESGTVEYMLRVGTNGRVKDCRILQSSGSSSLDAKTCQVMRLRARFTPAQDLSGKAVEFPIVSNLTWVLVP